MSRENQHSFTFRFIENESPDNNASQRAILNAMVQQKISGQFELEQAAQNFANIGSLIDTTIKNGLNVPEAFVFIAKYGLQTTE